MNNVFNSKLMNFFPKQRANIDITLRPTRPPQQQITIEDGTYIIVRPGDIVYNPFGTQCSKRKSNRLKEKLKIGRRKTLQARSTDSFIGISNGTDNVYNS